MTSATLPGVADRRSPGPSLRGLRPSEDAAWGGRAAPSGGETTLDEVIVDAWEGLASARAVACPVCAGAMAPHLGGGGEVSLDAGQLRGGCADCGAELG